jgi:hypothetical protein
MVQCNEPIVKPRKGTFMSKINRNDPCPCGSGKKYKKCCGLKESSGKKTRLNALSSVTPLSSTPHQPSLALAQRVFKVISAQPEPAAPASEPAQARPDALRGYGSLEELIGIEGAPEGQTPQQ